MFYKEYGKTGKKLSAVGFGGMRFDMSQTIEENAELVLESPDGTWWGPADFGSALNNVRTRRPDTL